MKTRQLKQLPNSAELASFIAKVKNNKDIENANNCILTELKEMYKSGNLPIHDFIMSVTINARILYDYYSK